MPDPVLLPDGTRLVHIGPHKTGTTTLQGAFHLARREVARHGVHYAGANRQPLHAAQGIAAITDKSPENPKLRHWRRLVREVEGAPQARVVISSEWLGDARSAGIRRLADDLDRERLHIAVTLRPLSRILASQWQQSAQAGTTASFETWLQTLFHQPDGSVGKPFWHRHRHDRLVERWAEVVGMDRLTVVVADDRDRGALLRAFERLTGLPPGMLVPADDRWNRSLTAGEVELVRQLHVALRATDLDSESRLHIVLHGAAQHLKQRDPARDEPRIQTPQWALDESTRMAGEIVAGLRASGARIIGDLESLAVAETAAPRAPSSTTTSWPAVTATAAMGTLGYVGLARGQGSEGAEAWPDAVPESADAALRSAGFGDRKAIDALSTTRLRGVFSSRLVGALRGRVPRGVRAAAVAPIHSRPVKEQ